MRWLWLAPLGALVMLGCRHGDGSRVAPPAPKPPPKTNGLIVVPSPSIRGKIATVNAAARYVILSYPLGQLPPPESRLSVYRNGLKVAEIKVGSQSQRIDTNAVADILTGDCQPGDEVRTD